MVVSLVWASCQAEVDPGGEVEASSAASAAESVMAFELQSLDGDLLSPRDLASELLLIDFWATWCGPCELQAEILASLYPEFRERGVEFVAVSLGETESVVREFVSRRPFDYPVLIDPDDYIATNYGILVLPTVVLLDRDGAVRYLHEGISTASRLTGAIDGLLEGHQARGGRPDPGTSAELEPPAA